MNTLTARKLVSLLSRVALLGFAAFLAGLAFDTQALALFAFSVSSLVLLVVAGDYAPRASCCPQRPDNLVDFASSMRTRQPEKLAA